MTKKKLLKQAGFLLVGAIFLIIIIAFISGMITYMLTTSSSSVVNRTNLTSAFYAAEAGLEKAAFRLIGNDINERTSCANITGNSEFNNIPFNNTSFTVTASLSYANPAAVLTSGITSTATIIPVSSLNNYAPYGRVMIDREAIRYTSTSTSSTVCGTSPCLTGVSRGDNSTQASAHALGTAVGQDQCRITSTGTAAGNTAQTTNKAELMQLEEGWILGDLSTNELILRWDGANWSRSGPYLNVPDVNLYAISALSYADVWGVGTRSFGPVIIHWNGSSWERATVTNAAGGNPPNQPLSTIDCLDANYCWAAGNEATFIEKNGTNWVYNASQVSSSGPNKVPLDNILGVSCINSNNCFAVSIKQGSRYNLLSWNGSIWSAVDQTHLPSSGQTMHGIKCLATGQCFAVGELGAILYYNGGPAWTTQTSPVTTTLESVACTSSNNCWAVGAPSGGSAVFLKWNGTSWSRVLSSTVPANTLRSIACANPDNCWAVGANGTIAHWDGNSWINKTNTSLPNVTYNAVAMIAAQFQRLGFWHR